MKTIVEVAEEWFSLSHEAHLANGRILSIRTYNSLWQKPRSSKNRTSGAKARLILLALSARLKSCPFKTRLSPQDARL